MPLELYRAWKNKNKTVGCVFARFMAGWAAKNPARFGHRAELIAGSSPTAIAIETANRVTAAIADPGLNGLALVFPDVTTLQLLVDVAEELGKQPEWSVTKSILTGTPVGDALAFHMSRRIAFANDMIPSEVLVLGPFPEFPNTRRAPVTALELYVGDPPAFDFMGKATTKGHLALIDLGLTPDMAKRMADETRDVRLESLGGIDDARAKAKVAFSVPMNVAATLGCVP